MLADRVGVVEGVLEDLAHGHVPNIFSENWAGRRSGSTTGKAWSTRVLVGALVASAALAYVRGRKANG